MFEGTERNPAGSALLWGLGLAVLGYFGYKVLAPKPASRPRLPKLLSDDCAALLVTSESLAALQWQDWYLQTHAPPPPPSDPSTMEGWIARFVMAVFDDAAPHCRHLFDQSLAVWPERARTLFQNLVYAASVYLKQRGYNVDVPGKPSPL